MAEASGYDFSPLYHASSISISPGSTFLATVHSGRVIIRTTANLSIVRTWYIRVDAIHAPSSIKPGTGPGSGSATDHASLDTVQWSDDGLYVLVFSRALGTGWVFGLAEEGRGDCGEVASIKAEGSGVDRLERVEWAGVGREVLGWTEHGVS